VDEDEEKGFFARFKAAHYALVERLMKLRAVVIPVYFLVTITLSVLLFWQSGRELFPDSDTTDFRIRMRCQTGTRVEVTEEKTLQMIDIIKREAGPGNVEATLGYAGQQPVQFVISSVSSLDKRPTRGCHGCQLAQRSQYRFANFKDVLRSKFAQEMPNVSFSFEPGDLVSQIMNLGSPTPIAVVVKGPDLNNAACLPTASKQRWQK
jgi:multidrug efflux pump subunit AcrB